MAKWFFEPGHAAAEFCVRHMMVTLSEAISKTSTGRLSSIRRSGPRRTPQERGLSRRGEISEDHFRGKAGRSDRRRRSDSHRRVDDSRYNRTVPLRVRYLGQWQTPWWEGGVDKGTKARAGFTATATINRQDFGVSWNSTLDRGGVVVGNLVEITIDAEAILQKE